ncbi:Serine endopeptidase/trypsin-like serine proteinase family protein [Alcanivorax hongdengensis A-11-3]|uniref:Serine endopeptidase/trypsin-like serine proteinase family protein n=1 Tax=Alcanivorax hongdengensis A-11-3 TaxID=1177179 RepID=L0W9Y3_9GAMM|nr:serine protease [Alcanivorax hongdengensis]EKF73809.1 Serine endopeptidase/trypsin-like serine proteinase family protein [Alcanivorax hongdengensis A-11-3]
MRSCCIALLTALILPPMAWAAQASPRVIGGDSAPASRWPWMTQVAIEDPASDNQFYSCGGSQISPRWVITAAHCMGEVGANPDPSTIHLFIGQSAFRNDIYNGITARQVIIHPNYHVFPDNAQNHDLALIRIDPRTGDNIWPSLASDQTTTLEKASQSQRNEAVTVLGWGTTSPDSNTLAQTLQEARLDYVPRSMCRSKSPYTITDYMVCAQELNPSASDPNGEDTCYGDSGGPLFVGTDRNPWLIGVTSFGTSKCANGLPSIYTSMQDEAATLESLTADAGYPLVDLAFHADDSRRYLLPGDSTSLPVTLRNDSQATVVNQPRMTLSMSSNGGATATYDWPGCSSLSSSCQPLSSMASGTASSGNIQIDSNTGGNQLAVATLKVVSDKDEYRIRNNTLVQEVVFSTLPDLTLTARQTRGTILDNGLGEASVSIRIANRSTLKQATGVQLALNLPAATRLSNASALGCSTSNPILCPIGTLSPDTSATVTLALRADNTQNASLMLSTSANEGDFPTGDAGSTLTLSYDKPDSNGGGGGGGGTTDLLFIVLFIPLVLRRGKWQKP